MFVNNKLKFIVNKVTLFLGKISFALYLIHESVSSGYLIPTLTQELKMNFWIASVCIALPTVLIIASLITFYIEIPMKSIMKEKLRIVRDLIRIKEYN